MTIGTEEKMGDNEIDLREATGEKLGFLDRVVGRIISRKFFVFLTATGLMIWSTLDPRPPNIVGGPVRVFPVNVSHNLPVRGVDCVDLPVGLF